MRRRRQKRHWAIEILRWTAMLFYIVGGLGSLIVLAGAALIIAMDKHADSWAALDDLMGFSAHTMGWLIAVGCGAALTLADFTARAIGWCARDRG
jgi:hypothetical protein